MNLIVSTFKKVNKFIKNLVLRIKINFNTYDVKLLVLDLL